MTSAAVTTWSAMLARWRSSDHPAIISGGGTWTGGELLRRAAGAADHLRGLCEPGPVPALVASSAPAVAYLIGGADCGRPLAPLGPRLTPRELVPCVERLGATAILADRESEAVATEVASATGRDVSWLEVPPESPVPLCLEPGPEEPAFWLHTSGTTGVPKPVPYRQGRLAKRALLNASLVGFGPDSVYASASGFHHVAGLGNYSIALAVGAAIAPVPRFTVDAWRALADLGVTHALTVPTMLEMLLDAGALALPDLRTLQYGAAPIHPDTLLRTLAAIPDVALVNIYGQTEGSPITCLTAADHRRIADEGRDDLLLSVGRPVRGLDLQVDEPDDDGIGEVVARGEHLFLTDSAGWLRTGDYGRVDAESYLFLAGRRGEKIIRGGENIYPAEVETVLEEHAGVREAAVHGVPDRIWGQRVRAVIVAADPARPPDAGELQGHVRAHLSSFKVPSEWAFVEVLPRNANGKLLRSALGTYDAAPGASSPSGPVIG